MSELMQLSMPLDRDPKTDPDDETLLRMAKSVMDEMAAERGLHAVSLTLVGKLVTIPTGERHAYFTARAIAI